MYSFALRLGAFGRLPEGAAAQLIAGAVEWLASVNLAYLVAHPETPALYASGVRYRTERDDSWSDVPITLAAGSGDCEDLTAWRLAELWRDSRRAWAVVEAQPYPGGVEYHVLVETPEGLEDPSEILGMR